MILFVDDELRRIDPILSTVKKAGYPIYCVDNGIDCIAFVKQNLRDINLLIVDLMIPYGEISIKDRYSGIQLITDIQSLSSEIPIIVYTNVRTLEIHKTLINLGIREIILKTDILPFEFVQLIAKHISQNDKE